MVSSRALMLVSFGGWNGTGLAADPPAKGERKEKEPPSLAEALGKVRVVWESRSRGRRAASQ